MANQRDHYRDRAIEAVAWLILRLDNDYELLDGDDLAAARSRAVELGDRRRMIRRPSPVRERMGYRSR
jgi:very-short-patch-repair endonuclease